MEPDEPERLFDERVRQLPPLRAPGTLLPRVMEAVQVWAARPWYARAWFTWPVAARVAVLVALAAGVAGVTAAIPAVLEPLTPFVARASADVASPVASVSDRFAVVFTAISVVWRVLIAPIVPYAFGLVLFMFVACALAGSALSYLVFGKASDR
jgi:hypothetical protein